MAKLRILVVCSALILCGRVACAQTGPSVTDSATSGANTAAELLTKLDQLVEKNQQLEKQNHELIGEINALRQFLAQQTSGPPTASKSELAAGANSAVPPQSTANNKPPERPDRSPRRAKAIKMTRPSFRKLHPEIPQSLENSIQAAASPLAGAGMGS